MRTTSLIFSLLLVGACQSVETPQQADARITAESATVRSELEPIRANFERWMSGDADSAATILTEDHNSLPPNQPAGAGRAQWLSWTKPLLATGTLTLRHVTESVVANGPLAVERGRYTSAFVPGQGAPAGTSASADTGKYLWQWRKIDGRWLIAAASWNSDLPVPK